jgi:hypothetical protein
MPELPSPSDVNGGVVVVGWAKADQGQTLAKRGWWTTCGGAGIAVVVAAAHRNAVSNSGRSHCTWPLITRPSPSDVNGGINRLDALQLPVATASRWAGADGSTGQASFAPPTGLANRALFRWSALAHPTFLAPNKSGTTPRYLSANGIATHDGLVRAIMMSPPKFTTCFLETYGCRPLHLE